MSRRTAARLRHAACVTAHPRIVAGLCIAEGLARIGKMEGMEGQDPSDRAASCSACRQRAPQPVSVPGAACTRAYGNRSAWPDIKRTNSPFMAGLRKSFFLKARDFAHAGEASIHIQNLLKSMHLDSALIRRIAICSYEGEMNAAIHGGDANIQVDIETDHLILEIADDGPGIEDIARAMQPGYSTAPEEAREMGFGAGMGLPNMQNNSDEIRIECAPGRGTRVHMKFLYDAERDVG